jgi:hypothetical protein
LLLLFLYSFSPLSAWSDGSNATWLIWLWRRPG